MPASPRSPARRARVSRVASGRESVAPRRDAQFATIAPASRRPTPRAKEGRAPRVPRSRVFLATVRISSAPASVRTGNTGRDRAPAAKTTIAARSAAPAAGRRVRDCGTEARDWLGHMHARVGHRTRADATPRPPSRSTACGLIRTSSVFTVQSLTKPGTKQGKRTHEFNDNLGEAFYQALQAADDLIVFARDRRRVAGGRAELFPCTSNITRDVAMAAYPRNLLLVGVGAHAPRPVV